MELRVEETTPNQLYPYYYAECEHCGDHAWSSVIWSRLNMPVAEENIRRWEREHECAGST